MDKTLNVDKMGDEWIPSSASYNTSRDVFSCAGGFNNTSLCINSGSSQDDQTKPPYTVWQIALIATLAGFLSIVTIVGNLIVILSFIIERTIRQPTNYYIASLAVSDLLIGAISMPFFTVYLLKGEYWPLGEILCDLWLSIDYMVCLTSIYTVFCITIDRFCSVKIPAKYRNWRTERKVLIIISITWIVPAVLFFTSIFGWQYFVGERTVNTKEKGECWIQYMDSSIFNCVLQIAYFWVTLVVMISLYGGIYKVALDLHKKSQAKKNKMTSLVSMAGQTMTKIGIGMSQQQTINTNKLFPPQKPSNSDAKKQQRPRVASTTSFSSTRGDKDERSSSPAFPSDTDPDSNSPAKHSDSVREKRSGNNKKRSTSSKSPKKLKKGPLKSKSQHHGGQHKDSLKQSLMSETTMDKSFTTETTGLLLTQLHNSSGSTATNSTSGFVSSVSNASSTVNTNMAQEERQIPLNRNSLLIADANYHAQQAQHNGKDLGELKSNHTGNNGTMVNGGEKCKKLDQNTKDILQGAQYIEETFLKALQSADRIKLMGEFNDETGIIPGGGLKGDEDVFYCKAEKDLSPVWKRKSWAEEQKQINDKADKVNWESVQDTFSVNGTVQPCSGTVDCSGSKSTALQMYSDGSLSKLNSGKQEAIKGQHITTNPHHANGNPFSVCEKTNHGLLIINGGGEAVENRGTEARSKGGGNFPNGSPAERRDIPKEVSHSSITADNDVRQYNPSLCSSNNKNMGVDDCTGGPPSYTPQPPLETQPPAITGKQEGGGDCGLMSTGLSLADMGLSPDNSRGEEEGDTNAGLESNLMASAQRVNNSCKTEGGVLEACGQIREASEKEEDGCSNNNSGSAAATLALHRAQEGGVGREERVEEDSGEGLIKGGHHHRNLLSPAHYRPLKSTSDESINNDHPSSSTSKASDYQGGETSNEGAHSPHAEEEDVTFAQPRSSSNKKGGITSGGSKQQTNKRRRRKINHNGSQNSKNGGNSSQFRNFIKSSRRRERRKPEKQKSKSENRARKALRTITIILGAFVLCWTPWHVFSMLMGFDVNIPTVLYNISYWFCYLNSPINPFCYAFANQQFKKTFIRIIKLDWHKT